MDRQLDLPGTGITAGTSPEDLIEQDILDPNGDKWPKTLSDMVGVAEAALTREGIPADQAIAYAAAVVLAIGDWTGGRLVYIPRGTRLATALRHARAWRMWRGDNIDEITAFLGVSQVRAYAVLAEQRALHRAKVQPTLFGE